jgi:hypothetical protein
LQGQVAQFDLIKAITSCLLSKLLPQTLGVQSIVAPVRSDPAIEEAVASLATQADGGLVIQSNGFVRVHRQTIIASAARPKIPAVYPLRLNVGDGGLMAYGPSYEDLFRRVAEYVDRIWREAGRAAGSGANQVRAGDQSQGRESARFGDPAAIACDR